MSAPETHRDGVAVVFPGMADTGFAALGRFLVLDRYARGRVAAADEVLGYSLLAALRAARRDYDVADQVAFLVASVALADRAGREHPASPAVCVGVSSGHRALCAYTGALDFAATVRLTAELARQEHDYFAEQDDDPVTRCFVHVPEEVMTELVDRFAADGWAELSGRLDDAAWLVSVGGARLDALTDAVRAAGGYALRTLRPAVHARRFAGLRARFEQVLAGVPLAAPGPAALADRDGRAVTTPEQVRTLLLDGADRPLDWPATVRALVAGGVGTVHIAGPDQLLYRMAVTSAHLRVVRVTPDSAARPPTAPAPAGSRG